MSDEQTTCEQTLKELREKNAQRQREFYNQKKDEINKRRREFYARAKQAKPDDVTPEVVVTPAPKKGSMSQAQIFERLASVIPNPGSLKTYQDHYKAITKIAGENVLSQLKKPNQLIDKIENAKKPNGDPYSINTRKSYFELLIILRDKLDVKVSKAVSSLLNAKLSEYKILSDDYNKNTRGDQFGTSLSFPEYLDKVKNTFGEKSKMFILSKLYEEFPLRDDFSLQIVEKLPHDDSNYIVIPKRGKSFIVVRKYKTSKKYGEVKQSPSPALLTLLKSYIKQENLDYGSYLFGDKPLTDFVSKANKAMGLKGGITQFRNMAEGGLSRNDPTAKDRAEMAERLKHSTNAQKYYLAK